MADWRDRRVPEFQAYLRNVLGREPTERDYAAAIMQLEARGHGSVAVGHAFRNRIAADGGDAASHLRHYDPVALGHRWRKVTPAAIDKWGAEYDRISAGEGPLRPGQTHFFSPAGMQAYYARDPSLVRSAVRMDVPGHGEVLVPSWATKAVAAGDFVNVDGQWHLTPNERYGQPAPDVTAGTDAEAQRDGFYGDRPVAPAAIASPAPAPRPATPEPQSAPPSGQPSIDAAMRVVKAFGGEQRPETESIIETTSGGMTRSPSVPINAPIPYLDKVKTAMRLTKSDGGAIDGDAKPDPRGIGRFAAPQLMDVAAENAPSLTSRLSERLFGVGMTPYADGGAVDDTGLNVPETREALMAQQRQLIEGRRAAQMFPRGTPELPLPPGMKRIETNRGAYHYDPAQVSGFDVERASLDGRENDILGLGPLSKADVVDAARRTGEAPVAIVERDRAGNELRASMATPSTVPLQADEMLRSSTSDDTIDIEPVEAVVGQRNAADRALALARAEGGAVDRSKTFYEPWDKAPAELHQWEPAWYDRLAYGIGDGIDYVRDKFGYGPMSTGQRYDVNKTVNTAPVIRDVKGVDVESRNARGSFDRGDYLGAAGHVGMAGLHGAALAAPVHVAQSAVRGVPSARHTLRENSAWEANTPRGRMVAEEEKLRAMSTSKDIRTAAEIKNIERAAANTMDPHELRQMKDMIDRLRRGDHVDAEDLAYAGYLADKALGKSSKPEWTGGWSGAPLRAKIGSTAGGAAISDTAWNGGFMPWNWNAPGTLQNELRNTFGSNPTPDAENQPDGYYGHRPIPLPISDQVLTGAGVGAAFGAAVSPVANGFANAVTRQRGGYKPAALVSAGVIGGIGGGLGAMSGAGRNMLRDRDADAEMLIRMSPQMTGPIRWPHVMPDVESLPLRSDMDRRDKGGRVDNANDFKALTPEQKAAIDRDKIDESLGPFDFMPGPVTALGAGIGSLFAGRLLANIPKDYRYYRHLEGLGRGAAAGAAAGDAAIGSGVLIGGTGSVGYGLELKDRILDRQERERQMMFGNPDDAEGQPGGFYGEAKASGGGVSDVLKGIAGSGLLGIQPMAFANGIDEEDLISPMAGLMQNKAAGGGIGGGPIIGALAGATGGRADKIPGTARSGSHVIPADVVAHMGQGNTNAGLRALERMFKTGPYGMTLSGRRRGFADGGEVQGSDIPVMLSDGEFVIPPEIVAEIGDGDVSTGHDVIDGWIMDERARHIETLQALPPPATD